MFQSTRFVLAGALVLIHRRVNLGWTRGNRKGEAPKNRNPGEFSFRDISQSTTPPTSRWTRILKWDHCTRCLRALIYVQIYLSIYLSIYLCTSLVHCRSLWCGVWEARWTSTGGSQHTTKTKSHRHANESEMRSLHSVSTCPPSLSSVQPLGQQSLLQKCHTSFI